MDTDVWTALIKVSTDEKLRKLFQFCSETCHGEHEVRHLVVVLTVKKTNNIYEVTLQNICNSILLSIFRYDSLVTDALFSGLEDPLQACCASEDNIAPSMRWYYLQRNGSPPSTTGCHNCVVPCPHTNVNVYPCCG